MLMLMDYQSTFDFFKGKKVLITGHTGFKGTWLTKILMNAGAEITGYSLNPPTEPSLFKMSKIENQINSVVADVRDLNKMSKTFEVVAPEIVFHLAAQPIVKEGYRNPRDTYEINVMGTVNVLECVRLCPSVRSVVNITTDKVYRNKEWCWGYRENESLDGYDPYSNSKSCSELVTNSYKNSFFLNRNIAVSTARAGNVIGGGDFAPDRIIPDCIRAVREEKTIKVRNKDSIRPYQHVLEPLFVYMMIAANQYVDISYQGCYNVGPDDCDCITTGMLVDKFVKCWGDGASWTAIEEENAPHEANYLKLDCSLLKNKFAWCPKWHIDESIRKVCEFNKEWLNDGDISSEMDKEIEAFFYNC